jgi:hypothetical protein
MFLLRELFCLSSQGREIIGDCHVEWGTIPLPDFLLIAGEHLLGIFNRTIASAPQIYTAHDFTY